MNKIQNEIKTEQENNVHMNEPNRSGIVNRRNLDIVFIGVDIQIFSIESLVRKPIILNNRFSLIKSIIISLINCAQNGNALWRMSEVGMHEANENKLKKNMRIKLKSCPRRIAMKSARPLRQTDGI